MVARPTLVLRDDTDIEVLPPDLVAGIDQLHSDVAQAAYVHQMLNQQDVEQPEGGALRSD